jgi:hypothetical protein
MIRSLRFQETWSALTASPQDVDPLSWLVRPWVGLVFGGVELVYGLLVTAITWNEAAQPWLDVIAVLLMYGACLGIQYSTRPLKRAFGPRAAALPLLTAVAALLISAIGNIDHHTAIEHWWVPIGVGLVLANCGPYSTALELAAYGTILTAIVCVTVYFTFQDDGFWSHFGTIIIAASVVLVGGVASAVFAYVVVRNTQRALEVSNANPDSPEESDEAARLAELAAIARLASRVAPFLKGVAEAGEVTEADRTHAGQLARRLRTDLVSQANRSWLDAVAVSLRIYVVDPEHRANSMTSAQRTALRGLLNEIQRDPAVDTGSLFIEFRGQGDGSTAVALSLDLNLPEGTRTMMIAPYYLALKSTVRDISWDPVLDLVRFRLPAKGER